PLARQVRTDHVPAVPAIARPKQDVAREKKNLRIDRREEHGGGADETMLARANRLRGDVLHLASSPVELRDLAAVDDVGVERVGGDVAVLLDADRVPIAEGNLPVAAAATHAGGAALLLAAVDPARETVVGTHV